MAPSSPRPAHPLRAVGAAPLSAAAAADNAARMRLDLSGLVAESTEASLPAGGAFQPQDHKGPWAGAGAGNRDVSFGHESIATTATQSIHFAEDLIREKRGAAGVGAFMAGRAGAGGGSGDGGSRASVEGRGEQYADDSWGHVGPGGGFSGHGHSIGGQMSWEGSRMLPGAVCSVREWVSNESVFGKLCLWTGLCRLLRDALNCE